MLHLFASLIFPSFPLLFFPMRIGIVFVDVKQLFSTDCYLWIVLVASSSAASRAKNEIFEVFIHFSCSRKKVSFICSEDNCVLIRSKLRHNWTMMNILFSSFSSQKNFLLQPRSFHRFQMYDVTLVFL